MKPRIHNLPFETLEAIVQFVCRYNLYKHDCRIVVLSWKYAWPETLITTFTIKLKPYFLEPKQAHANLIKDIWWYKIKLTQLFEWEYKLHLNVNTKYTIEV